MNHAPKILPDDPAVLQEMVSAMQAQLLLLREQHEQQISILLEQIRMLRLELFGKKSEKLPAGSTMVQIPLFDLPEPEDIEPAKVVIESHSRKKPGRRPLPADLLRMTTEN
jgi:transposase